MFYRGSLERDCFSALLGEHVEPLFSTSVHHVRLAILSPIDTLAPPEQAANLCIVALAIIGPLIYRLSRVCMIPM